MTTKRITYATQAIGVKPDGDTGAYTAVTGGQSIGVTTTFNIERYFQLGMAGIYQNIEDLPDVQVTVNRLLDGHAPLYSLVTQGANAPRLLAKQNQAVTLAWSVVPDTFDSVSGVPLAVAEASGMQLSSYTLNITTDTPASEDVTLVGNDIFYNAGGSSIYGSALTGTVFNNTETPLNIVESGGLQTRERVVFYGQGDVTLLPRDIPGISESGTNNFVGGEFGAHVQEVSFSFDFGREDTLELGALRPYLRAATLPVDISTTITVISVSGAHINAGGSASTEDETIKVVLRDGTIIDAGNRNRLLNAEETGGDTAGGLRTISYSYQTSNDFTLTHPQDPTSY